MKHDVFISYSRKDSEIAAIIQKKLKDEGLNVFIDQEDLSGGEHFTPELARSIEESLIVLFLASANSYGSKWTSKEIHFAIEKKEDKAILPYRIDDAEIPSELKLLLSDINWRNIHDHPIETVLIDDIKRIKELFDARHGDDTKTARAIADSIKSRTHSPDENASLLDSLGETVAMDRCYKEAIIYFDEALKLYVQLEKGGTSVDSKKYNIILHIADAYYNQTQFDKAEEQYLTALNILTDNHLPVGRIQEGSTDTLLIKLALCQRKNNKIDLALKTYNEALRIQLKEIRRRSIPALVPSMELLNEQGRYDEAMKLCDDTLTTLKERALKERAEKDDTWRNTSRQASYQNTLKEVGDYLMSIDRFDEAYRRFSELVSFNEAREPYSRFLMESIALQADCLTKLGKTNEAEECYDILFKKSLEYLRRNPQNPLRAPLIGTLETTIDFLQKNNKSPKCDLYYSLAICECKLLAYQRNDVGDVYASVLELYANWLKKQQRFYEAGKYYQQALDQYHSYSETNHTSKDDKDIVLYSAMSETAKMIGAEESYARFLELALDSITSCNGDHKAADNQVIGIFEATESFKQYGMIEAVDRMIEKTLSVFDDLEIDDTWASEKFHTNIGWLLLTNNYYEKARKHVELALKMSEAQKGSTLANAQNNAARLYLNIGRYAQAEELLDKALHYYQTASKTNKIFVHNYAESLYYKGWLLANQNKLVDAEKYYVDAIDKYTIATRFNSQFEKELSEVKIKLDILKTNLQM